MRKVFIGFLAGVITFIGILGLVLAVLFNGTGYIEILGNVMSTFVIFPAVTHWYNYVKKVLE